MRGRCYHKKGEWDNALADFSKVLTLDLKDSGMRSDAACLRGACYHQKGEWNKAKADFELSLRINPRNLNAISYQAEFKEDLLRRGNGSRIALQIS